MGLRETKMERTRQLIADAAFDLFVEQGYDHTTIEQIAAAAEVGTRTLYRYYPTKEALVADFVDDGLTTAIAAFLAQPDETPLPQALYAVIESAAQTIAANSARLIALHQIAERTPAVRARFADQNWRWRQQLAQEILHRTGGTRGAVFAALTAAVTMNVIEVIVQTWVASDGTADAAEIARETLNLLHTNEVPVPTP